MIAGLPAPENIELKDIKSLPHPPGLVAAYFLSAFLAQLHHLHVVEAH